MLALGELHQLAAEVREPPVFEFCSGRTKKKSELSLLRDLERLETWRGCCLRDDECDDGDDDRCRRFQRRRSFPKKTCPSRRRTLSTTTKVEKRGKNKSSLPDVPVPCVVAPTTRAAPHPELAPRLGQARSLALVARQSHVRGRGPQHRVSDLWKFFRFEGREVVQRRLLEPSRRELRRRLRVLGVDLLQRRTLQSPSGCRGGVAGEAAVGELVMSFMGGVAFCQSSLVDAVPGAELAVEEARREELPVLVGVTPGGGLGHGACRGREGERAQ